MQPTITRSELRDWENKFKSEVSAQVQFDQDQQGNTSFKLYDGQSGIDGSWSGRIMFGAEDFILWKFSVQNGVNIEMRTKLTDDNYKIIENIYLFFKTWKGELAQNVNAINENGNKIDKALFFNKERMSILSGTKRY